MVPRFSCSGHDHGHLDLAHDLGIYPTKHGFRMSALPKPEDCFFFCMSTETHIMCRGICISIIIYIHVYIIYLYYLFNIHIYIYCFIYNIIYIYRYLYTCTYCILPASSVVVPLVFTVVPKAILQGQPGRGLLRSLDHGHLDRDLVVHLQVLDYAAGTHTTFQISVNIYIYNIHICIYK